LEQWFPFDFSNQAMKPTALEKGQLDMRGERFGDWRRAPADWSYYHPSYDDYQVPGHCRRTIFRTLNLGTRLRLLTLGEIETAFARANEGIPTIISFADHDWRDMRRDVRQAYEMVTKTAQKFPEVTWRHAGARDAAQLVLGVKREAPIQLKLDLEIQENAGRLTVSANKETFGPQPFLAIKTLDKCYINDNFDFDTPRRRWHYTFDANTVLLPAIEAIGVGVNDMAGNTAVALIDTQGKEFK
jgi:hypothetical protein